MESTINKDKLSINDWWAKKRLKYNFGLIIAGITGFIIYATVGTILYDHTTMKESAPYEEEFEITLFTIIFQGIGYVFMIGIANLLYFLGPFVDKQFNKDNSLVYRQRLFNLGFWFSCLLPFLIPILLIITYALRKT